jgi:hypothetical protein
MVWDEGFVEQFGSRGHDHSVDEGFGLGNWDRDVTGWGRPYHRVVSRRCGK